MLTGIISLSLAAPGYGTDIELEISKENCRRLVAHRANADVNYKAGVDVYGRPVVPADISSRPSFNFDRIIIELSLPLQDLLSDPPKSLENADVLVGEIQYDISSGKMLFNGEPIANRASDAVIYECKRNFE